VLPLGFFICSLALQVLLINSGEGVMSILNPSITIKILE
jgi:hypothetical protein